MPISFGNILKVFFYLTPSEPIGGGGRYPLYIPFLPSLFEMNLVVPIVWLDEILKAGSLEP